MYPFDCQAKESSVHCTITLHLPRKPRSHCKWSVFLTYIRQYTFTCMLVSCGPPIDQLLVVCDDPLWVLSLLRQCHFLTKRSC